MVVIVSAGVLLMQGGLIIQHTVSQSSGSYRLLCAKILQETRSDIRLVGRLCPCLLKEILKPCFSA